MIVSVTSFLLFTIIFNFQLPTDLKSLGQCILAEHHALLLISKHCFFAIDLELRNFFAIKANKIFISAKFNFLVRLAFTS